MATRYIPEPRECLLCDSKIRPLEPRLHKSPESGMWHNGIVDKISAGYGSELDGNMYLITICDNCIIKNKDKFQYIGNYIG